MAILSGDMSGSWERKVRVMGLRHGRGGIGAAGQQERGSHESTTPAPATAVRDRSLSTRVERASCSSTGGRLEERRRPLHVHCDEPTRE
jgi:hypothetical protein